MTPPPIPRPTARILLADHADRLLLFQGPDLGWFTPGGGLEDGEPVDLAAVRELREETGYQATVEELGPVIAIAAGHWRGSWDGLVRYSVESFYFLRVEPFEVDTSGLLDYERETTITHHWWTLPEIRTTNQHVVPWGLADLLSRLYAGEIPEEPVRLPWHHPDL
ncbi:NUDIX domain-containing protein [Streptosporangiaceae bacterium NEAU-GS5]|nr:NUDIX domain-containing protein [Streptosporangiaceae bacterium NEAU-GS5]